MTNNTPDTLDIPDGWHRHPNGGGLIQNTAHADPTAYIGPDAKVSGNARVSGNAQVSDNAHVSDNARVSDAAHVSGNAWVLGDARVSGYAWVYGHARVFGYARITNTEHVLTIGPIGSENQTLVIYRTETGHSINIGCWDNPDNTIDDLAAEVERRAPEHREEYAAAEQLCRLRIADWHPA